MEEIQKINKAIGPGKKPRLMNKRRAYVRLLILVLYGLFQSLEYSKVIKNVAV